MARPPKLAKPPEPGVRYLYTPVYMRRSDEDAFEHCLMTLEQCGHILQAEHDHAQLRFRLPVNDDGTCPICSSPIGGQYTWQFYTDMGLDGAEAARISMKITAQEVRGEGRRPAPQAPKAKDAP